MLRWLILIQAVVYLLIMPSLRASMEPGYDPPLLASLVAIMALIFAGFVPPLGRHEGLPAQSMASRLEPRSWLWIAWIFLAVAYAIITVRYGLLDRRQGSEYMAELYATLPLPVLAILRTYELLLVPVIIIYAFGSAERPKWQRTLMFVTILASLPFMGLADSRGRLIIIGISIAAFVPVKTFISYFYRNVAVFAAAGLASIAFLIVSMQRAEKYGSFKDYLFLEVYSRLDGLNLVVKLKEASLLSYWGKFDLEMVTPLIAKIPFLEAAQTAKLLGRTSTKQYIIQDLLRSNNFDDSNSMVTDPLYFGGLFGLLVAFFALGLGARAFDRYVLNDRMLVSFVPTTLALAFGTGAIIFENDYVGSIANMALSAILIAIFLVVGTRRTIAPEFGAILPASVNDGRDVYDTGKIRPTPPLHI